MRSPGHHEVGQHLDVVVVLEAVLDVSQKLEDVQPVDARLEECVHALEGRLAQVQAVVHLETKRRVINKQQMQSRLKS